MESAQPEAVVVEYLQRNVALSHTLEKAVDRLFVVLLVVEAGQRAHPVYKKSQDLVNGCYTALRCVWGG